MAKQDGGIFMHAARPAEVAENEYSDQHYFGTQPKKNANGCLALLFKHSRATVTVMRFASESIARVEVEIGYGHGAKSDLNLPLTADQLQTLACALLDAAHELRTVPATSEEEVAA